jgi:hypothetical protein
MSLDQIKNILADVIIFVGVAVNRQKRGVLRMIDPLVSKREVTSD